MKIYKVKNFAEFFFPINEKQKVILKSPSVSLENKDSLTQSS